jgi:hypothetical protein
MRYFACLVTAVMLLPVQAIAADPPSETSFCLSQKIGLDFLEVEFDEVALVKDAGQRRIYQAKRAGRDVIIEVDACTTQILSERVIIRS